MNSKERTAAVMKWLKKEYGITTEAELDRALERTKLDIGLFVSPLPPEARQNTPLTLCDKTHIIRTDKESW